MKRPLLVSVCLIAGCAATAPRPALTVPERWSSAPPPPSAALAVQGALWERFACPELHELLQSAARLSPIAQASSARAQEQQALARVSRAALYPTLTAEIDLTGQTSNSKSLGSINGGFLDVGLLAAYDVDVWGEHRASAAAAAARSQASEYERAAAELAVSAQVAERYFELLSLRERKARAAEDRAASQRVLDVVEARERAGTTLAREVAQQRALVASESARVEQLTAAEFDAHVALALATGREPSALSVSAQNLEAVAEPGFGPVDIDIPARLLRRRPDVARAEAQLTATRADVKAAQAALLPKLRAVASAALQGVFLTQDYNGWSPVVTGTVALTHSIFDGGALSAERDAAAARRLQAEADYRRVVLQAVSEVERALGALAGLHKQHAAQHTVVSEAERAFTLIEVEYREGAQDLLAVLDAQRTLFRAEDDLSQVHFASLRAAVLLIEALGGDRSSEKWSGKP